MPPDKQKTDEGSGTAAAAAGLPPPQSMTGNLKNLSSPFLIQRASGTPTKFKLFVQSPAGSGTKFSATEYHGNITTAEGATLSAKPLNSLVTVHYTSAGGNALTNVHI